MDAEQWDDRYRSADLVWTASPNRFVVAALADVTPGRAMDLAAGEGRNAIWLAERGWQVTAVDFSAVGLARATRWAEELGVAERLVTEVADVTDFEPPAGAFDAVVVAYLQVPAEPRRRALTAAAGAVAQGGRLVVVAHDSSNLAAGVGGPQEPAVLYTPEDIAADIADAGEWTYERAEVAEREVAAAPRPARDAVVVARRVG